MVPDQVQDQAWEDESESESESGIIDRIEIPFRNTRPVLTVYRDEDYEIKRERIEDPTTLFLEDQQRLRWEIMQLIDEAQNQDEIDELEEQLHEFDERNRADGISVQEVLDA